MNILKFAIFLSVGIGLAHAEEFDGDLEKIETVHGKRYEKIYIVGGDGTGLTFRHKDGIAKVDFSELPMNLRMLYEPVDAGEEEKIDTAGVKEEHFVPLLDFSLRYRPPAVHSAQVLPLGCCSGVPWKPYWPRFHPAHQLVDPLCREAVLRDFLYTTGLVCPPCGIVPRRLPYDRPYLVLH